ncbi:O-antigen translocase [Pontixanthobacter sp.]|uniref:O-antigen translocase n=1 Tax=Pontixanthobacter sp. TaxID=2792078 RepID=UPI003C7B8D6F
MVVIGSAQAVNILISIVRMKVLSILLGPSGVGLLSVYSNFQITVQQASGIGMSSSGVREIAASRGEPVALSRVRRVLFAAHLVQGGLAMVVVWLLQNEIASLLFGSTAHATEVGLIGVAVLFALLSTAQTALLQGMRRIADLGQITVIAAFLGTIAGLGAVWLKGEAGLIVFVIVQPLSTALIALRYTRRLAKPINLKLSLVEIWETWKPLASLGSAFMLGGLATTVTLLLVLGRITQELGLDSAGHFAAAWGISMTYVGLLLAAMGADYYPRLTEAITNRAAAVDLMNDQAQLALAIGGPILLLLIGLAPIAIALLYSAEFEPSVNLLQWQTVGNVFKLASWPLGFAIAASARGKTFLAIQLNFNILFLLMLWPTLETFGIQVAGPAFTLAYFLHFLLVVFLVRNIHGFCWQSLSLGLLGLHATLSILLLSLALTAPFAAALASPIFAGITGLFGLRVVLTKVGTEGRLASRLSGLYTLIGWPIQNIHND